MWLPFATSLKQTIETMSVKGIYMEEDKKEEIKIVKVTEELIKAKTYEVRGYKVMLDFDWLKYMVIQPKLLIQDICLMLLLNKVYTCL